MTHKSVKCYCNSCKNDNTCITQGVCYTAINNSNCKNQACNGCFNEAQIIQCDTNVNDEIVIKCCREYDYCNSNLTITPTIETIYFDDKKNINAGFLVIVVLAIVFLITLIILISLLIICFVRKRRNHDSIKQWIANGKILSNSNDSSTKSHLYDDFGSNATKTLTSSDNKSSYFTSGSGAVELIKRTIARDLRIDYTKPIGQGRFGVVWKAEWNSDYVAVKSFFSIHEPSWKREIDIYQTNMLNHDNILRFIAADIKGNGHSVSLLLITEYHQFGSLYDYLQNNNIDFILLKKFSFSIINGLNHLHTEIFANKYKPAIVHRDLKSKNILVKTTSECCIADFGLAVRFDREKNKLDVPTNQLREGSQRYMAPECLDGRLNIDSIDELKYTDIYSFSLVLWELIKRYAENEDEMENYEPPYFEHVNVEPSIEEMKAIVCDKNIRPTILDCKIKNPKLEIFIKIIHECWQYNSFSRSNSLRIKKDLSKINCF